MYHITVLQTGATDGETRVAMDGAERFDKAIHLVDDRQEHSVIVTIPMAQAKGVGDTVSVEMDT